MDNHSITQRQITRANNDARVGAFTLIAGFVAFVMMAGFIAGYTYHPLWYSLSAGAATAGIMFTWRVIEHDRRAFTTRTATEETGSAYTQTIRAGVIPNGGKSIKVGKFALSHKDWHKLCNAIFGNDGRFTRDVVAGAGVFKNITANWRGILEEFERVGLVSDSALTDAGYEWFNHFVSPIAPPPPPPGTAKLTVCNRRRPTTTADDSTK